MRPLAGIFVGGRGSRMGGVAKGLLASPDGEPIVLRTRRLLGEVGADVVLVGAHPAYRELGLPVLDDDPDATGPLAGMLALLGHAGNRTALAIACDMPFIGKVLLERLLRDSAGAAAVAPRRPAPDRGRPVWEPLFARYEPAVEPVARELARSGERSLQALLDAVDARALPLEPGDEPLLADWDTLPVATARDTNGP